MLRPEAEEIVGKSPTSAELREFVKRAAKGTSPVLLLGEAGTGKEKMARAIHIASPRRQSPFLMVDCSLFYERELERELFGYRPGPGEPPEAARQGLLELSPRGSCYAANVEELSPSIQLRILNLLDTGYLQPVGSDRPQASRVRLIFSSEKNLEGLSSGGLFSPDLFQRFSGFTRRLPPLRERPDDIAPLVRHFAAVGKEGEASALELTEEALDALRHYPWPGNLDELQKEVARVLRAGHRRVEPEGLAPAILHHFRGRRCDPEVARVLLELDEKMKEFQVMGRLDAQYGDVLLDVQDWDVLFNGFHR